MDEFGEDGRPIDNGEEDSAVEDEQLESSHGDQNEDNHRETVDVRTLRTKAQQRQIKQVQKQFQPNIPQMVAEMDLERMLSSPVKQPPTFNSHAGHVIHENTKDKVRSMLKLMRERRCRGSSMGRQRSATNEIEDVEENFDYMTVKEPSNSQVAAVTLADCFRPQKQINQ